MPKEIVPVSPDILEGVDELSLQLWHRCVRPEEQGSAKKMRKLIEAIQKNPYPVRPRNKILRRMVEDGAGFDGYNAAMMTLGWIASLARYYQMLASEAPGNVADQRGSQTYRGPF